MNNEELQCMWFVKGAWGAVCRQISFLIFDFVWEQGLIFNENQQRPHASSFYGEGGGDAWLLF